MSLRNQGWDVLAEVQDWAEPRSQVAALEKAGCTVRVRRNSVIHKTLRKVAPVWGYRWLARTRPDLVVISQGMHTDALDLMHWCRERNLRYCVVAQAASEHFWPADDRRDDYVRALNGADALFFVSKSNLALATKQAGVELVRAGVVRNPFNVPSNVELPWPDQHGGVRLACVGRLEPRAKGQDILFETLSDEKWRQRDLHVTLFGNGPNKENLLQLQRFYGLTNVTFGGFVTTVTDIWRENHALVLPSRHEGLPLCLVEAMLCGRPSIVTDVGGAAELVEDGVTGFLASAPTVPLFDAALERAWVRRTNWEEIGHAARTRILQKIPADPVAEFVNRLMHLPQNGADALANAHSTITA